MTLITVPILVTSHNFSHSEYCKNEILLQNQSLLFIFQYLKDDFAEKDLCMENISPLFFKCINRVLHGKWDRALALQSKGQWFDPGTSIDENSLTHTNYKTSFGWPSGRWRQ